MNEEIAVGQVWHFYCQDVDRCDDYYLFLRSLACLTLEGMWEAFDLTQDELMIVCPCGTGE